MAYRRAKKFYKCGSCYSNQLFCTHKKSAKGTPRTKAKRSPWSKKGRVAKRSGVSRSAKTKKSMKDLVKIDAPVMAECGIDEDGDALFSESCDVLPLDGVRARGALLTHMNPVANECKAFEGKAVFSGVTEDFKYELIGEGPFLHRRVLFRSKLPYSLMPLHCYEEARAENKYRRGVASDLCDSETSSMVRRLFGEDVTVRTVMFGKVVAPGVTILEDKVAQYEAKPSGTRRSKKYYNAFGKNKRGEYMKYTLSSGGGYRPELSGEEAQHTYVVDFFQYGMLGLDIKVPPSGVVMPEMSASVKPKLKHVKRESDSDGFDKMDDVEGGAIANEAQVLASVEKLSTGSVKIWSNMKLYFYLPKSK